MLNKIYKKDNLIYRILKVEDNRYLVIDCVKRSFPKWIDKDLLMGFEVLGEEEFLKEVNVILPDIKNLTPEQLKEMHWRYGTISRALIDIGSKFDRGFHLYVASVDYKISEQTLRKRLCDYLVFQNITVLAPVSKKVRELSKDEKNFRWALNKYFYNSKKLSLRQAYKFLVRDKYLNSKGEIIDDCPTFHQFKYYYYKNRNESNYIISRLGRGEYDRNYRPLLGDGVREKFPSIGYGMLDSTTCDIFLVDDTGKLLGRPIMTACVDAYSGMCLGYSIGWEGGIKSLRKLMENIISDKQDWCKKFGINIEKDDWNSDMIPHKLITDKGREYVGETFSQLTDLGIEMIDLEPYRPELKSSVERFFGLVQDLFKKELINKGVVLKDFGDRGAIDYRKNACLTLEEFEKILILCIIHYNCARTIELPYEITNVKKHCKDLWNHCLKTQKDMLIKVDDETLNLTLLPRTTARFTREGLIVNKLRYRAYGFTNEYLLGKEVVVAYDQNNVGHVWLIDNGSYIQFDLIEKYFDNMSLDEVGKYKEKNISSETQKEELQFQIKLSKSIEDVVKVSKLSKRSVK